MCMHLYAKVEKMSPFRRIKSLTHFSYHPVGADLWVDLSSCSGLLTLSTGSN